MRLRRLLSLTWLAAILIACGGSDDASGVRIDMAASRFITSLPIYIAVEEGYFEDEGIDLVLHPATETGSTALPSLDQGRVATGVMSNIIAIVNAIDQGARVRIVAGKTMHASDHCGFSALVARKDLVPDGEPITPSSLRGLRIDLNPLSFEGYFLESYLAPAGLSLNDIEQVYLPVAARLEAMNRGAIDLTVISEPWLTRMIEDGHRVVTYVNEVTPNLQASVIVFGTRLLDEDRETGRRFLAAYYRGVQRLNEGPTPRNVELASRITELDPEILRRLCWPTAREDGGIEAEAILDYERWALRKGHIARVVEIDELWDPWFTEPLRNATPGTGEQ
jgi:NitT/TauT family transport system substrate-binding protein